jgi:hypothetical protein
MLPERKADYGAAVDVGKNRWTLVLCEAYEARDDHPQFRVALAEEFQTANPEDAWRDIATAVRRYDVRRCVVDQYAAGESAAIARRYDLDLTEKPWSASNRLEAFTNLATLLHSDRLELAPERTMLRDLRSVKKRATQAGYTIVLPQTSDGRHCDFAPALAASLQAAADGCKAIDLAAWCAVNRSMPADVSERVGIGGVRREGDYDRHNPLRDARLKRWHEDGTIERLREQFGEGDE